MSDYNDIAAAFQGASNAIGSLVGSPAIRGRVSYNYAKKFADYQNQLNIANWEKQNERQDYLMNNAASILKNSLHKAGYSAADPNGTGVQPGSPMGIDASSGTSIDTGQYISPDVLSPYQSIANARLINEQANNLEIKNRYEVRRQEGEVGVLELDLKKYQDTFREQCGILRSKYQNLTKENRHLDAVIDNLEESTRGMHIDNNFNEKTFTTRVDLLSEEWRKLKNDADISEYVALIKKTEKDLAECGFFVGQSFFSNILSAAALGKGKEATKATVDFIQDVLETLIDTLPSAISSIFTPMVDKVLSVNDFALYRLLKKLGIRKIASSDGQSGGVRD